MTTSQPTRRNRRPKKKELFCPRCGSRCAGRRNAIKRVNGKRYFD